MQEAWLGDGTYSNYRRGFADVRPRVYQDGDSVSLQFQIGEIQSEMLASDPNFLLLSYTRTMAAFTHFYQEHKRIAIIGLGGGSIPKWCYHHLPATDITVIEVSAMVISLREHSCIPADDDRFHVIRGDGADYVAVNEDSPEVLLVDGFDIHGSHRSFAHRNFTRTAIGHSLLMEFWSSICAALKINKQLTESEELSTIACLSSLQRMEKTRLYSL